MDREAGRGAFEGRGAPGRSGGMSMRTRLVTVLLGLAVVLLPATAQARYPRLTTDGLYVGVRALPDAALLVAWDLDVYVMRNRLLSIGPAVSVAVLGGDAIRPARPQDLLLAVDVIRLKVGLNEPGGRFRPHFLVGGGFTYYMLPEHDEEGVTVIPEGGTEPVTGRVHHPAESGFGGILTLGAGADVFFSNYLGMTGFGVVHVDFSEGPLPTAWLELAVGIRFGL